jgi:hypothetical protein
MNDHAYNAWLGQQTQLSGNAGQVNDALPGCLASSGIGNLVNFGANMRNTGIRNALVPLPPKRVEPSRYLFPKPGQPRLDWVPARFTDIRVLFRRVRREMESKT